MTTTTNELRRLLSEATPGPWHARATDDWKCQTAFYVSTLPGSGMQHDGQRGLDIDADIDSDNIVAVTLLQSPPVATAEASDANTELIAAAVNALPLLLDVVDAASSINIMYQDKTLDAALDALDALEAKDKRS